MASLAEMMQGLIGNFGSVTRGFQQNGISKDGDYGEQPAAPEPLAQGAGNTGQDSRVVADFKARQAALQFATGVELLMKRGIDRQTAEQMIRAKGGY